MDSGGFQIRSVDLTNPEIEGLAGPKFVPAASNPGSDGGSGGSTDEPGSEGSSEPEPTDPADPSIVDTTVGLAARSFSCGPLSYTLTEKGVELAEANAKALTEGRTEDIRNSSEGWSMAWYYGSNSAGQLTMIPGLPPVSESGTLFALSSSVTPPDLMEFIGGIPSGTKVKVYELPGSDFCNLTDLRAEPQAGITYSYLKNQDTYTESRYEEIDGKLTYTTVDSKSPYGYQIVTRTERPGRTSDEFKSPTSFYGLNIYDNGNRTGFLAVPETRNGYNRVEITINADGAYSILHRLYEDNKYDEGPSTFGPAGMIYDKNGKLVQISYRDGTGNLKYLSGSDATVANFNRLTGLSWDGSHENPLAYDYSIPFQPTAP